MITTDQEKLNRLIQELTSLRAVATACVEETREERLIERVTANMSEAFQVANFGVILLEEGSEILADHPSYRHAPTGKSVPHRLGEGIVGTVAQTGKPMVVPYVKREPLYQEGDPQTRSELCVPLAFGERVFGVINVESTAVNAFSEADEHLLVTLAGLLAPALVRLRSSEAVQDSAKQYRSLYEDLPSMYFTLDTEGKVLSVNRFGLDQLGYTAEDLVGKPVDGVFHQEDREAVRHQLSELLKNPGEVAHWEFRKIRKDGSVLWVKESARAMESGGDKPVVLVVCEDITDRKNAELALRESQEKYRSIFDNALEGMFQTTVFGDFISANPALAAMHGYASPEELMSGVTDLGAQLYVDPNVRPRFVERVITEGDVLGFETELLRKDGSRFWAAMSARAVYDEEGKVRHLEGSIVDVTERKEMETELRESEKRLKAVIDGSSIPQFFIGKDHRVHFWNRALEECTGIRAGEVVGTDLHWRAFYQEPRPCMADLLVDGNDAEVARWYAGKGDRSRLIEGAFDATDFFPDLGDSGRWLSFTAVAIRDSRGEIIGALETLEDVTERKRAEGETSHVRNFLKNIIDSMPSILVGIDPQGRVTEWNSSAEHLTGLPSGQAKGQPLEAVFPWLAGQVGLATVAAEPRSPRRTEKVLLDVEAEKRYTDVMVYPLVANGVSGAVIRVDDVTDRVKMEQMMVQTEKIMSVGGIAAGVAHEINNPLGGVLQGAQNIVRRLSPDLPRNLQAASECGCDFATIRKYMEKREILDLLAGVQESGERVARIVSDMMQFSRPSTLQISPADLRACIDKMVALAMADYDLMKRCDLSKIEIMRTYDPELQGVPCITTQIESVILNLLKHCAQALHGAGQGIVERPPRITLRTRRVGDMAQIEVEDNGPGMDEEARSHLFEPFYPTKDSGPGTGLGFSVSFFIITDIHKGEMVVESAPGEGEKFTIRIPVERRGE